ncbi:MAG: ribosomal protein S18-alanine N-acetyltransferase [Acidimicrobiales bacterium]
MNDHVDGLEPQIVVRPFAHDDVAAVHNIEEAVSPDPWSAALFADELVGQVAGERSDRYWLVAELDGRVVGFGGLLFAADEAHIMNLAVAPELQRRGIAALLVARLLAVAGDRGATAATLEVRASNLAALALYQRFGFDEAGRRPRYYPDGEDALILWVHHIYRTEFRKMLAKRGRIVEPQ